MTEGQTSACQLTESVDNLAKHNASQATPAGYGEAARADMLDKLWKQHRVAVLTLSEVRESYFRKIKTDKHLRALIRKGKVKLQTFTMTESRLDEPQVTLEALAELLVSRAKQAAQQNQ